MSHTKPTVNYVRYDRKRKNKGKLLANSTDLDNHLQIANQMPMENLPIQNFQSTGRICYRCRKRKHQLGSEMFCNRMLHATNVVRKDTMQ